MPSGSQAFYPTVTMLISLTTVASSPVQPSTAGFQWMKLDNLSTNQVFMSLTASSTPAPVLATTTGAVAGFMLPASAKNFVVSTPPNPWAQAMTTGAALTAILALQPGIGID